MNDDTGSSESVIPGAPRRYESSLDAIDTVVLSTVAVAWTALPDYVSDPILRRGVRTGLLLGAAIVGARAYRSGDVDASDGQEGEHDPSAADAQPQGIAALLGETPRAAWVVAALGAAGLASLAGSVVLSQKIDDAAAGYLERRGVGHPYTVTGLTWGVLAALTARLDPADRT